MIKVIFILLFLVSTAYASDKISFTTLEVPTIDYPYFVLKNEREKIEIECQGYRNYFSENERIGHKICDKFGRITRKKFNP